MNWVGVVRAAVWLLPASRRKNAILRRLGHQIDSTAWVGPNLVWNATVTVGPRARIGRYNRICADLTLADRAKVTSWHRIECPTTIGTLASVAGHDTRIIGNGPVTIGGRAFIGTRTVIHGGSRIPARSLLAAGAEFEPTQDGRPGLWAGHPAVFKKPVSGAWFDREHTSTRDVFIPETGEIVRNAF